MAESSYKKHVFDRLRLMFPGCEIIRTDSASQQGLPDHIILWGPYWASLEFKVSAKARRQPNQEYFVQRLDDMSFAAFIYPENEDEVLHALEQAFTSSRRACVS
jgi:uncharacterized protein (DUF736 family)